ncbi:alpha/beta fold hydrolase [Streptacidiphilus cavernicola]|uniref:Alpha/beta fold hydrolase n=1 Tax=Streptacidiphilus cavernicola TaxID=3342716 RepID=A0ABV6VNM9_9ACTN
MNAGRKLTVSEWGKRTGTPVFLLHGTPGSRLGVAPRPSVLYQLGIRLIAYDRPGYGESARHEGRSIGDAAADVRAIADELEIDEFAVLGRSGGGPHALACAALLPERVTRAAAMVSLAPKPAVGGMGTSWYEGMTPGNVEVYLRAEQGIGQIAPGLTERSSTIRANPAAMLAQLLAEVKASDLQEMSDAGIRRMLKVNYQEALRDSGDGWIDDAMAFIGDWGFRVEDIRVPVLLWHGKEDSFSPVQHSQWLHRRIPESRLELVEGKAHFAAVSALPGLLPWLKQPREVTRSAAPAHG